MGERDQAVGDANPRCGRRRRPVDHGAWFLVLPALIPILVLSVGPLLYGIALAFTDAQSGRSATRWIGALNFQDLLHDALFWESFRIGLLWAVGVTVPQFLLALGLALLLNQDLRLRPLARALAIIPWAMPEVVVGIDGGSSTTPTRASSTRPCVTSASATATTG